MASSVKQRIADLRLSSIRQERYLALLACVAVLVATFTVYTIMRRAIAMNHVETVLDCHYDGNGAHTHNADCYDGGANLVCPLQERELHVHDDSCYTEELVLTCGLAEDEEHTHTDECYETIRTLTCGKEEVTEEHVHGPSCFKTIRVSGDENEATVTTSSAELPAEVEEETGDMTFEEELTDAKGSAIVRVRVLAPAGAFPEGTVMRVEAVAQSDVEGAVSEAVSTEDDSEVVAIQAIDITFLDPEGNEIEPSREVSVTLTSDLIADGQDALVVHVDDEGRGDVIDTIDAEELERRDQQLGDNELAFDLG